MRKTNTIDTIITQIDHTLKTIAGTQHESKRKYPADDAPTSTLTETEKKHAAGLMRVNYAGEVAAQALYQGQALTARLENTRESMQQAAFEEQEHLAWCRQRLTELDADVSYLNPIWYCGSLLIGLIAGLAGDKWSLGFVVETEQQVVRHLEKHLGILPEQDKRSQAIVKQMQTDEAEHAQMAQDAGATELPEQIKTLMTLIAKIMTKTAYHF